MAVRAALDVNSGDALPEGAHGFWGGRCLRERGRLERGACLGKPRALVAVSEQAVVADAVEASGQHVQREAAQKFDGLEVHDSSAHAVRVVLVAKAHRSFIGEHDAFVGNRAAMRVAAEILEHLLGAGEGALGVHDPGLGAQFGK